MSEKDKDIELLDDAASKLGEHFDAVHIFASRHESEIEDGTISVNSGVGNHHTRYGQIKRWVIRQDEYDRCEVRNNEKD